MGEAASSHDGRLGAEPGRQLGYETPFSPRSRSSSSSAGDRQDWAGLVVLCVLLAVPSALLCAFAFVIGEILELPDKLHSYPGTTREHLAELSAIALDAQRRERPAWRLLPESTWRLATLVRSARDLLAPHAPLLPLFSVAFLVATLISALMVPVVVLAALVVLLAAAAA